MATSDPPAEKRHPRRRDPDRRGRILRAALEVIAADGVEGASLRRIADHAGVPLGSLTYHFDGRVDLLAEAFRRYTDASARQFRAAFDRAEDLHAAREAVVAALSSDATTDSAAVALSTEMYALSLRSPRFAAIFARWVRLCREAMATHFDWPTTLLLDALYEGLLVHRHLQADDHDEELIRTAVHRLTPPESYHGTGRSPEAPAGGTAAGRG